MTHRWYAVQTTSGHENKVRTLIQRKIDADPAAAEAKRIRQALVPTEQVVEIKNGKKVTVDRKVYPGYVLVEMAISEETLHTINAIQGVIKFVGTKDREPQALRDDEVKRLLGIAVEEEVSAPKEEIPFLVGQAVAITFGRVSRACSARNTLMRVPRCSSIHMRAPPAPQHIALDPLRANSSGTSCVSAPSTRRGASNSSLWRPR